MRRLFVPGSALLKAISGFSYSYNSTRNSDHTISHSSMDVNYIFTKKNPDLDKFFQ